MNLIIRMACAALTAALCEMPITASVRGYTIYGADKTPYITRTLFPRMLGKRVILHRIWRADADPYLHNHPWKDAKFLVVSGGYTECRKFGSRFIDRTLRPGDVNSLNADTFHRVDSVLPNTWTIGLIGKRVQEWGFLVDGKFIESRRYFAGIGHQAEPGAGRS